MRIAINQKLIELLVKIGIVALVAKIVTLPLFFYLPYQGVEPKSEFHLSLYKHYLVTRAFDLEKHKRAPKVSKKPIYRLTNVKLKAIYAENGEGVVALEEKNKLIFLSTGERFKSYKLIEVKPDRAIFEKDGKHYELKLEEKSLKDKFSIQTPQYSPDEVTYAILKRDIDRFKRNFNEIWKNISIQEQIDPKTKRLTGFKVTRINKDSIFGKIGLQKGDIIIGANNKTFHSYSDVLRLYNNIDKYNSVKITIIRNKEKKDLEYEIY